MFTIGFDLPIWQAKYRAGVREAEKLIESSRAELEAVRQQTSFDVRDAQFKLLTARKRWSCTGINSSHKPRQATPPAKPVMPGRWISWICSKASAFC